MAKKAKKKVAKKKEPLDIEAVAKAATSVKEIDPVHTFLSTGCTTLDLAIANQLPGGIPIGRIVQCFGASSTCKSVLGMTLAGAAIRAGIPVHYGDVEHTLDPVFAGYYGCDMSNKLYHTDYPVSIEDMFERWLESLMIKKVKKGQKMVDELIKHPKVAIVDSVSALPAEYEIENSILDRGYSPRARQMSKALRKYVEPIASSNTTVFCIDQTRDKVGSFVGGECVSGGRSLKFYASTQIYLTMDAKLRNTSGKVLGHWVKFSIVKNKVGPPFREGRFLILFDYGLDDISSNLYFLAYEQSGGNTKEANKLGYPISFMGVEKKMSTWVTTIEHDNLEGKLKDEVYALWQKVYAPIDRKPRIY